MRNRLSELIALWLGYSVLVVSSMGTADTIEISVGQYYAEIVDLTGLYQDLAAEIDLRYTEGDINVTVYPYNRSLQNVVTGKADIHLVQLVSIVGEAILKKRGIAYVSEPVGRTAFSTYYKKDNIPFKRWIDSGYDPALQNDLVVVLAASVTELFPQLKNVQPTSCIECSLKKILKGRADAFLYANLEVESIMRQGGFDDIAFGFYQYIDVTMIYRLDERGRGINRRLTEILRAMRLDGSLDRIMKPFIDYHGERFNEAGYMHGSKLVGE